MKIIVIAHQKGGVGKTTTALNIAHAFASSVNVGIYDMDLQGSLSSEEVHQGLNLVAHTSDLNVLRSLVYDVLIIDTPPYLASRLNEVLSIADLVIVPTKSSYLDALAIVSTLDLIMNCKAKNKDLKASILFTQVRKNSSLSKEFSELISELNFPVFKTQISDRVSYVRSLLFGGVLASTDKTAAEEVVGLCEEIVELLKMY